MLKITLTTGEVHYSATVSIAMGNLRTVEMGVVCFYGVKFVKSIEVVS